MPFDINNKRIRYNTNDQN